MLWKVPRDADPPDPGLGTSPREETDWIPGDDLRSSPPPPLRWWGTSLRVGGGGEGGPSPGGRLAALQAARGSLVADIAAADRKLEAGHKELARPPGRGEGGGREPHRRGTSPPARPRVPYHRWLPCADGRGQWLDGNARAIRYGEKAEARAKLRDSLGCAKEALRPDWPGGGTKVLLSLLSSSSRAFRRG